METIKRAILQSPRELEFEALALDRERIEDYQVYAATEISGVSVGTEMAAYSGQPALRATTTYPRLVGYCNIAKVLKTGSKVTGIAVSDRIITHQCHQSAFVCDEKNVLGTLPDSISSEAGSLTPLGEIGFSALQASKFPAGGNIAVLGLGVLGLATVGVARALGAQVVAIGNDNFRMEKALEQGAQAAFRSDEIDLKGKIDTFTKGAGIDVIVTTANTWQAWRTALEVPRYKGKIAVLGFPGRSEGPPPFNPLDSTLFHAKQLSIYACGISTRDPISNDIHFNCKRNVEILLQLTEQGRLDFRKLITHRVPWHDLEIIYKLAEERDKSLIGAVLDWGK